MLTLLPPQFHPETLAVQTSNFITQADYATPSATFACCQFSLQHFSLSLFSDFGISLPPHLQSAVKKRQAEYLASRWLVATLLQQRGFPQWQLHNRADRSPIWPTGIAGSLSHHKNKVFVVLTSQPAFVGNDIELTIPEENSRELSEMVMDKDEAALLTRAGLTLHHATTLLFSIKETVYKAVYPEVGTLFGFDEVKLHSLHCDHALVTLSTVALPKSLQNNLWRVNYWQTADEVLTWKILSPTTPGER